MNIGLDLPDSPIKLKSDEEDDDDDSGQKQRATGGINAALWSPLITMLIKL